MYNPRQNPNIMQNRLHLKRILKNPLTLTLGILYFAAAVLPVVLLFTQNSDLTVTLDEFSFLFQGLFESYNSSIDIFFAGSVISLICAIISPLLLCVGFILTFATANSKNASPKGGTATIIIGACVTLIGFTSVIAMAVVSIINKLSLLTIDSFDNELISYIVRLLVLIFAYLLSGLGFLVFAGSVNSMCSGKRRSSGGSVFYGVSSISTALVYMLFIIDISSNIDDGSSLFVSTLAFSAVIYIISAVFAFVFNSHMKKEPEPVFVQQPVYTPPSEPQPDRRQNATSYGDYGDNFNGNDYSSINDTHSRKTASADTQKFPTLNTSPSNTTYEPNITPSSDPTQANDATVVFAPVTANQPIPDTDPSAHPAPIIPRTAIRVAQEDEAQADSKPITNDIPAFCPECGTPFVKGQPFCSKCGNNLKTSSNHQE